MNKLFNNIRCVMIAKSAAIMGLIASSLFSANAYLSDLTTATRNPASMTQSLEKMEINPVSDKVIQNLPNYPSNFTISATGNPSPITQTIKNMKITPTSDKTIQNLNKPLYDQIADGLLSCIKGNGTNELKKAADNITKKYNIVSHLNFMQIVQNMNYLQDVTYKIITGASESRYLINSMVYNISNEYEALEAKAILNNIFNAQNNAINHLFNNGFNLYGRTNEPASQSNETFLSKIIRSGIKIDGLDINEAIKKAPANANVLGSIVDALLNSNALESDLMEKSRLTKKDIKTGINILIERLNRPEIKNSPNAKSFSNMLLVLEYTKSADELTQNINASMSNGKQFSNQQISLLNKISKLASNGLNTYLAGIFVGKIAQSAKNLHQLLNTSRGDLENNFIKKIINTQEKTLLNILKNKKIDIYATKEGNPSILGIILASDIEIPEFDILKAVENCPETLTAVGSLIEGLTKTEARSINDIRSRIADRLSEKLSNINESEKSLTNTKYTIQSNLDYYLQKAELKTEQEKQEQIKQDQIRKEQFRIEQERQNKEQEQLRIEQRIREKEERIKRERDEEQKQKQLKLERQEQEKQNKMNLSNNSSSNNLVSNYVKEADELVNKFKQNLINAAEDLARLKKEVANVPELEDFVNKQIQSLEEISSLPDNDLNTALVAKIVDRITESRVGLDKLTKDTWLMNISYGPAAGRQLLIEEGSLGKQIINAQNTALAKILQNQNINIYQTNGDNPSILGTILAADINIPGFDILKAIENCPLTLEAVGSLIEGLTKTEPSDFLNIRKKMVKSLDKKLQNIDTKETDPANKKFELSNSLDNYNLKLSDQRSEENKSKAYMMSVMKQKEQLAQANSDDDDEYEYEYDDDDEYEYEYDDE